MERISEPELSEEILASSAMDATTLGIARVRETSQPYYVLKRLIDVIFSFIGIIGLLPLFVVIALFIKLSDGGPIFYIREMIGLQDKRFFMLKFRTMIPNADAYLAGQSELLQQFHQNMKLESDP